MFILSEWVFPKLEALAPKPQGPAVRFRKKKQETLEWPNNKKQSACRKKLWMYVHKGQQLLAF